MIAGACGTAAFTAFTLEERDEGRPQTATTCTGTDMPFGRLVVVDMHRGAECASIPRPSSAWLKAQRGDLAGPGWPAGSTGGRGADDLRTRCIVCCACSDASGLQLETCTVVVGTGLPARLPAGVHIWLRQ